MRGPIDTLRIARNGHGENRQAINQLLHGYTIHILNAYLQTPE
jgi:hypothetical protein